MIRVSDDIEIPDSELVFTFSHSSKPGGQNVNKVSTRVTLNFDVANSPSLSDDQRALILSRLGSRISKNGILRISSQKHRTQSANRTAATARLKELMTDAFTPVRHRKKSRRPPSAIERRLDDKKRRGKRKRERSKVIEPPD